MQTILLYSRDSLLQCLYFAPVALSLLQIPTAREKYPQPVIREVRNEKELTKSASVIDPATLLSLTRHHHPMNTTRGTTSTRTPYSSRCYRWEISRGLEPVDAIVYQRHARIPKVSTPQPSWLRQ